MQSNKNKKPNKILAKVRGLWGAFSGGIILGYIIFCIYLLRPWNRIARKQCKLFFYCNGVRTERIGEFDKDAKMLILNHQSVMDILFIEAYYPGDSCFIAKKELGDVFFYGHALKGPRMILIDREDKRSIVAMLKAAKVELGKGRTMCIFPEGTRGKGGAKLLPFKSGAKILAESFNLRVQPIVFINTRKLFDPSVLEVNASYARAVCLPAFSPVKGSDWFSELEKDMQAVYLKHFKELN